MRRSICRSVHRLFLIACQEGNGSPRKFVSFRRISFILWRTTNRNRVVTSKFRSEGGRDRNGSSPGLGYGEQIYFPVIEQDDGRFTHSVASF
jgi:hypothetical protein